MINTSVATCLAFLLLGSCARDRTDPADISPAQAQIVKPAPEQARQDLKQKGIEYTEAALTGLGAFLLSLAISYTPLGRKIDRLAEAFFDR